MPTLQHDLRAKYYKRKPTDTYSSSQWDGSTTKGTDDQGCQRHLILIQNLSPPTYGWKDEPSHSRMPWSKFKSYLRVERRTKPPISAFINIKSSYLRVGGQTKSLTNALVKIQVFLPSSGRTNEVTSKCLGTKFKSFYLQVEGRTKSLTSVLIEI